MFKPLLLVLCWLVKRSGMSDMVKVIVQALRENVYVLFLESPTPFVYELDLWGSGVLAVGHWDEAAGLGGYLPEEPEADPRVIHYISTGTSAAPSGFPRLLGFLNLKYPVRTPTVARGPNQYRSLVPVYAGSTIRYSTTVANCADTTTCTVEGCQQPISAPRRPDSGRGLCALP